MLSEASIWWEPGREIQFRVDEAMTADADEGMVRVILEKIINNARKLAGHPPSPYDTSLGHTRQRF